MPEQPIHYRGNTLLSLRQIDRLNQVAKGTAFRAFKRVRDNLTEGVDFFVLDPAAPANDDELRVLSDLREQIAIYPTSRVVVLITEGAYAALRDAANLSPL